MAQFQGTSGSDHFTGTKHDDVFDMQNGGNDSASGGDGDDVFNFGAAFTDFDTVYGGAGNDTLNLNGNTDDNLDNIIGINTIALAGAHTYAFTAVNGMIPADTHVMTIDAREVKAGGSVDFEGRSVHDGDLHFLGGNGSSLFAGGDGDDVATLTAGHNTIALGSGGNDTVYGGATTIDTTVLMDASLTAKDHLVDVKEIDLDGDYTGANRLKLKDGTIQEANIVFFSSGSSYDITLAAHTSVSAYTDFNAGSLAAGQSLTFDGAANAGDVQVAGGAGDDHIVCGAGNDQIDIQNGGHDIVKAGAGNDTFLMGAAYDGDAVDGGGGSDTARWVGDFDAVLNANFKNVETFEFVVGTETMKTNNATVAQGATLTVDTRDFDAESSLAFDGRAERDGHFHYFGGLGFVEIWGGKLGDTFQPGAGEEIFYGGGGSDHYVFTAASVSTSKAFDSIADFDAQHDRFDFAGSVTGVRPTIHGASVSDDTFDSDIAHAVAGHLPKHQAVIVVVTDGDYAGFNFLIVDANGKAGYQGGEDYVIQTNLTALHKGEFI